MLKINWNKSKEKSNQFKIKSITFPLSGVTLGILREGFKKKKKNLEFSRFGKNHPPTLVIAKTLEK